MEGVTAWLALVTGCGYMVEVENQGSVQRPDWAPLAYSVFFFCLFVCFGVGGLNSSPCTCEAVGETTELNPWPSPSILWFIYSLFHLPQANHLYLFLGFFIMK